MEKMEDKHSDSLGPKLVLIIIGGLILLNTLTTWYNLYNQEKGIIKLLEMSGKQLSSIVAGAAKEGMLHNDREAIQKTVETLGSQYEISAIRILNKDDIVAYSSKKDDIGKKFRKFNERAETFREVEEKSEKGSLRLLELLTPIKNEESCYSAQCHAHSKSDEILGYLQINTRLDPFDEIKNKSTIRLAIASSLCILLTAIISFLAINRFVHKPIKQLMVGVKELSNGNLSVRVPELSHDELGRLAKSFNRMASELHKAHMELVDWASTLEFRVNQKTQELERAQSQIMNVEKMASLGRLAAVVAHEINNPLASIVTYSKLIIKKLKMREVISEDCQENLKYLEAITSEAQRCGEIVSQLLSFARMKSEKFVECNLEEVVSKAIFILHHKLEMSQVEVKIEKETDVPMIFADPAQIQQALMALIINSCEAMDKGGYIKIKLSKDGDFVKIAVSDNGPGMTEDVAKKAFEPFFTTKTDGSGAGLGLSVVYSIVMRHEGKIEIDTTPQKGATFIIHLPIKLKEN
jgi:two-component system NtrC family sensor kinase